VFGNVPRRRLDSDAPKSKAPCVGSYRRRRCVRIGTLIALSAATLPSAASCASSPLDLRKVNWRQASLPGSVCGTRGTIKLHNGSATVHSTRWPAYPRVRVAAVWSGAPVVYGDLNGDPRPEAAIRVACSNLGGTAAGQLAFAVVMFTSGRTSPRPVGVITPRQPRAVGVHVPIVGPVRITRGRVTASEAWYGPRDSDCCPSGQARTPWLYVAGHLRPGATVVVRKPRR
jgi:hypothetical protein